MFKAPFSLIVAGTTVPHELQIGTVLMAVRESETNEIRAMPT